MIPEILSVLSWSLLDGSPMANDQIQRTFSEIKMPSSSARSAFSWFVQAIHLDSLGWWMMLNHGWYFRTTSWTNSGEWISWYIGTGSLVMLMFVPSQPLCCSASFGKTTLASPSTVVEQFRCKPPAVTSLWFLACLIFTNIWHGWVIDQIVRVIFINLVKPSY